MSKDKKNKHWFAAFIFQLKINSTPYMIKTLLFMMVVAIIHLFSDSEIAKILSSITYTAGIIIDAYYLSKNCYTDSKRLEAFLYFHMLIITAGTFASALLLIKVSTDINFTTTTSFRICNDILNSFLVYATITPLLEAIVNCNENQLVNKLEKKEEQ